MRTTNYLSLSALVLATVVAGCSGNSTSTLPNSDTGGSNGSATGGTSQGGAGVGGSTSTTPTGGKGTTGGTTGNTPTGGTTSNTTTGGHTSTTPTGGTTSNTPTGGTTSNTPTGGTTSNTPTGGTTSNTTTGGHTGTTTTGGTTGNTPTGGTTGTTTTGGTTGAATGGTSSATGGSSGCTPGPEVLSDFEGGISTVYTKTVVPGSPANGYWYVYKDDSSQSEACYGVTQVPAAVTDGPVTTAKPPGGTHDGATNTCNVYALHSSITNCPTYSGFGAVLSPVTGSKVNLAVDISNFDGVTFWVMAGTGTQGPLYMEMQSQECSAPPPNGGGTAKSQAIDEYNCHGKLFSTVPTTWTQVWVPFGTTGPRWFPTAGASSSGKSCANGDFCEVPQLVTKDMLAIQFSLEDPFNNQATAYSNYDVWIDDVALYKFSDTPNNAGLAAPSSWSASGANPFPQNKTYAGCTKPTGADGKLAADAYVNWKKNFVKTDGSNLKVVSPEIDSGATVSEGIGYGMLIAVYTGDKALFDGLYGYEKAHLAAGTLMNWKIASGGSTSGSGSATDADEDMAFALLEAAKQWPSGGYSATAMISDIWSHDIDGTSLLPTGGSNYSSTSSQVTNPSYFAPAYYREFAKVDTGHNWHDVITAVYNAFNSGIGSAVSDGLVSAWCSNNCKATGSNGAATDDEYQYDSHRVPWRLGIDACWNSTTTGSSYLSKLIGFFNTQATKTPSSSQIGGLSNLEDIYQTNGTPDTSNGANNSMSMIGCAGVGAMATGTSDFAQRAWQFMLEGQYTANPTFVNGVSGGTKPGYTYYNATVGLMMMLTMSGNFYVM